jgi:sec-independent protein translocase protein TatB
MFDFGFQELMVIFIVALVVLGPKRMQQLAGTVGRWVGKARGMARQFREQLETEVNLDDLEKSTRTAAPFTPAPTAGLDGSPAPEATPDPTPENSNYPYGGTYPYGAPEAAPVDDTHSHAHGSSTDPMPYLPPEAEGFDAAPPTVPLDSDLTAHQDVPAVAPPLNPAHE